MLGRLTGAAVVAAVAVGLTPAVADAAPGSEIAQAQEAAAQLEQEIKDIAGALEGAQAEVEAARAKSLLALDEYQAMQGAYQAAQQAADAAAAAAAKATADLGVAEGDVVVFARRSYMEGSTYAGAAALLTSGDPAQLIERAALLEAAGSHRSDVLDRVTVLQEQATAADAAARTAVADAAALKKVAEDKLVVAQDAEVAARAQAAELSAQQAQLETRLAEAKQELASLVGAQEADQRAAEATRPAPAPRPAPTGNQNQAGTGDASAAAVAIDTAKGYLRLPYASGSGRSFGPGTGLAPDAGVIGI